MSISKISRTLVVILFLALIIFMGYQDVMLLLNNNSSSPTLNILKVVYIIVTALLVALYVYIKDKLYRKKVKGRGAGPVGSKNFAALSLPKEWSVFSEIRFLYTL